VILSDNVTHYLKATTTKILHCNLYVLVSIGMLLGSIYLWPQGFSQKNNKMLHLLGLDMPSVCALENANGLMYIE